MSLLLALFALCFVASNAQNYNRSSWVGSYYSCGDIAYGRKGRAEQLLFSYWSGSASIVTVSTCNSTFDTYLAFYNGYTYNRTNEFDACDDCGACGVKTVHSFAAMRDTYYVVGLQGYNGEGGDYKIKFTCEYGNDTTRTPWTTPWTTPIWTTGTTTTFVPPDMYYCGDMIYDSIDAGKKNYYGFMSYDNLTVTASTCGSYIDTVVEVYVWIDPYLIYFTGCDDCGNCGLQEQLTFPYLSPYFYVIAVSSYTGESGEMMLNITCDNFTMMPWTTMPWNWTYTTMPWTTMPWTTPISTLSTMSTMESTSANYTPPTTTEEITVTDSASSYSIKLAVFMVIAYFAF